MKNFILHISWRVILVRNLPFGDGEFRVIGYVSTIVGISGFNPRTRLYLICTLHKREGDLIFESSFFISAMGRSRVSSMCDRFFTPHKIRVGVLQLWFFYTCEKINGGFTASTLYKLGDKVKAAAHKCDRIPTKTRQYAYFTTKCNIT
ncbi:hypothetical protein [Nostoc sp. 'Peltigera membranacea cyanobiont' 232]|uniref:hypothetical protein n=1 Tax=Nostoc sp. 'Peltigera membranacea cyanobiont' 232 TaxID=2014531 RepID=UPI0011809FEF|nr:hypothetical protein [Nostoc sp. 'Peltigera membranacea cyanobiont' 232]